MRCSDLIVSIVFRFRYVVTAPGNGDTCRDDKFANIYSTKRGWYGANNCESYGLANDVIVIVRSLPF